MTYHGFGWGMSNRRATVACEAEAEDKTSDTIVQKVFDELPVS